MAQKYFAESNYRFTDPVRYFKANDPYYFEVDNIPLKQLQENCLWLKDQIEKGVGGGGGGGGTLSEVNRADIQELKPYANGGDRIVRVRPGRYTARINDAATKTPLAFLNKIVGDGVAQTNDYESTIPSELLTGLSLTLNNYLEEFKTRTNALGTNGLLERTFTRPVHNPNTPINYTGANIESGNVLSYSDDPDSLGGASLDKTISVVSQALLWGKSSQNYDSFLFETFVDNLGMTELPNIESFFIKVWRGITRLAIVDVNEELEIEVPQFNANDFNYIDENGNEVSVPNITTRIDLVFIYSHPVDAESTTILKSSGKQVINKPQLGIVRGAGIKVNFEKLDGEKPLNIENTGSDHKILATPGDEISPNLGFKKKLENDIAYDIAGSFPAPDDLLNIAPLICEKLESDAIELVGQSILPVAYVFVQEDANVVADTDVIDIRPLFRTAELAYNERAGIAAAMPQLSLANPAVGKVELKHELKRQYYDLLEKINNAQNQVDIINNTIGSFGKEVFIENTFHARFPQWVYNGNKVGAPGGLPQGQTGIHNDWFDPFGPSDPTQGGYGANQISTKFGSITNPRRFNITTQVKQVLLGTDYKPGEVVGVYLNCWAHDYIESSNQIIKFWSGYVPPDYPNSPAQPTGSVAWGDGVFDPNKPFPDPPVPGSYEKDKWRTLLYFGNSISNGNNDLETESGGHVYLPVYPDLFTVNTQNEYDIKIQNSNLNSSQIEFFTFGDVWPGYAQGNAMTRVYIALEAVTVRKKILTI